MLQASFTSCPVMCTPSDMATVGGMSAPGDLIMEEKQARDERSTVSENSSVNMDIDLQFCDEDETEVFIGNITEKELRKSAKFNGRRTVLFGNTDFRHDRKLMRYTMDRLKLLSIGEVVYNGSGDRGMKLDSAGSEGCDSPCSLGSSSGTNVDFSPLGSELGTNVDYSPLGNESGTNVDCSSLQNKDGTEDLNDDLACGSNSGSDSDNNDLPDSLVEQTNCESQVKDICAEHDNAQSSIQDSETNAKDSSSVFDDSLDLSDGTSASSQTEYVSSFQGKYISMISASDDSGYPIGSSMEDIGKTSMDNETGKQTDDTHVGCIKDENTDPIDSDSNLSKENVLCSDQVHLDFDALSDSIESSPLMSGSRGSLKDLSNQSPLPILGNLEHISNNSDLRFNNVFAGQTLGSSNDRKLLKSNEISADQEQQVPKSPSNKENESPLDIKRSESFNKEIKLPSSGLPDGINVDSMKGGQDLTFEVTGGDVSIVTLGTIMDDSILDTSRRIIHFVEDEDLSPGSHLVPNLDITPDVCRRPGGVVFVEKEFSPLLNVTSSPPNSDIDEELLELGPLPMTLFTESLRPGSPLPDFRNRDVIPEAPECPPSPRDVCLKNPLTESPRHSKVKRLSPSKSRHGPFTAPKPWHGPGWQSDPRPVGSVFERLYGLRKPHQPGGVSPAGNKPTMRKANSMSKLVPHTTKISVSPHHSATRGSHHTATRGTPVAKKGLQFTTTPTKSPAQPSKKITPGSIRHTGASVKNSSHKSPGVIQTTGTMDRRAVNEMIAHDKTPVKSKATPSSAHKASRSPGMPPVFRKGTPRHITSATHMDDTEDPLPQLNLDDSNTDDTDLSVLDDSIILQEKKVELERLRAEKLRLQKRIQRKEVKVSAGPRSPLIPTTADNLPKVRYMDKQALALNEPELDAITLVHTLCNSQQMAKLVSKARATNVVKQTLAPKPASKLQWCEDLVNEESDAHQEEKSKSRPKRRSILTIRAPGFHYPYSDQLPSPVVVTKSAKKFTVFDREHPVAT